MNDGERITSRLVKAGIRFPERVPNGTHFCWRGQDFGTWLVESSEYKGRRVKNQSVRWQLWEDGKNVESGIELTLADKASVLAREQCLILVRNRGDFDGEVMSLKDLGRRLQYGLGPKPLTRHWLGLEDPLAGREALIPWEGGRIRALVVEAGYTPRGCSTLEEIRASGADPQLALRPYSVGDGAVSLARLSEVELLDRVV